MYYSILCQKQNYVSPESEVHRIELEQKCLTESVDSILIQGGVGIPDTPEELGEWI